MALRFTIENVPNLPDGGPISFTVAGKRSVDIGRDQHLDWTLPDPSRFISGKHCEVHYRNDAYWLHDVSTNGTFLNGSDQRMRSPHQLKDGDRLVIGQYILAVSLDSGSRAPARQPAPGAVVSQQHAAYRELWANDKDVAPPIDRKHIQMARETARPINPDFLDWAAGVPEADSRVARRSAGPVLEQPTPDLDWAAGPSRPVAAPEPAPPVVAPRRPVWKETEPSGDEASPFLTPPASPGPPLQKSEPPRERVASAVASPAVASIPLGEIAGDSRDNEFIRRMARAAALPEDFFSGNDPDRLADQLGQMVRVSISSLMLLLQARNEAKRLTRSTTQTTIQATENNPLKFSPSAEDAMRILFGPKTHSYLDASRAFTQGFEDLKSHQLKTYMAMQHAVTMLVAELDPTTIIKNVDAGENVIGRLWPSKGRLWDAFLIRWKACFGRENGAIEAFMLHFADYYDQDDRLDSR